MMATLRSIKRVVLWVLEIVVAALMALLVLDVLWQIATRFMLGDPSAWTVELARYIMMWLAMLGAAVAFARREHLGMDYFSLKLHCDAQRTLAIVAQAIVIAFAGWLLLGGGVRLVGEVLATEQRTAALGVPMGAVYLATPIAGGCVMLFAIVDLLELIAGDEAASPEPESPNSSN